MTTAPTVLYQRSRAVKTRAEILKRAVDIASAEGLEGLSIGRLASELEMSKTGVFAHFGSKEELQLATVNAAKEIFLAEIVAPALKHPPGISRLCAFLDGWLSYVERIVFRGGCFFAAASAEFDSRPGVVRDEIVELTRAWVTALEAEVRKAQKLKQLSRRACPRQLVFELHAFVQEANWAFKLFDERVAFARAKAAITDRIARETIAKRETRRQK